jgi:hypothetical protein
VAGSAKCPARPSPPLERNAIYWRCAGGAPSHLVARGAEASAAGQPCRSHSLRAYVGVSRGRREPVRTRQSPVCLMCRRTCRLTCHLTCHCAWRHKRCAHRSPDRHDQRWSQRCLHSCSHLRLCQCVCEHRCYQKWLQMRVHPCSHARRHHSYRYRMCYRKCDHRCYQQCGQRYIQVAPPVGRDRGVSPRGSLRGYIGAELGSGPLVLLDAGRSHADRWALGSPPLHQRAAPRHTAARAPPRHRPAPPPRTLGPSGGRCARMLGKGRGRPAGPEQANDARRKMDCPMFRGTSSHTSPSVPAFTL